MPSFMDRNPDLRFCIATANVTADQFAGYTAKILKVYETYAAGLPENSAWKTGKVKRATAGAEEVAAHAELFGFTALEVAVVGFPLVAHDTGRLIHEHIQRATGKMPPWRHGEESALFGEDIFGPFAKTPLGRAILLSIRHHSDVTTPTLEDLGGDRAAHALTGIVRDFDKMAGFLNAESYVSDPAFKRRQIETNFQTQRKSDPTWGEEKGHIEPASMLDDFLADKALVRRDCQSYEAYMLQYLAWLFDIQNEEILKICVEGGGPRLVLDYLFDRLLILQASTNQFHRLFDWAKTWEGGLLLRT